jgi:hypothetical protein
MAAAMEDLGKAAHEQTAVMEGQSKLSGSIAALKKEKRLSQLFEHYAKLLKQARADLRELKLLTSVYKSDSSEANDAKQTIKIYKNKVAVCFTQLEAQEGDSGAVTSLSNSNSSKLVALSSDSHTSNSQPSNSPPSNAPTHNSQDNAINIGDPSINSSGDES